MKKLLLVIFSLFLAGCITGNSVSTQKIVTDVVPEETTLVPEIHFCSQEDCISILIDLISSHNDIDCALYELGDEDLKAAFIKANANLVLFENIQSHPGLMHNKFCVFDNEVVTTGSFNPAKTASLNDNNLVIIRSNNLAENYEQEFNELSSGIFASGSEAPHNVVYLNGNRIENYFCPEDKCEENLLRVLSTAQKSIKFMIYTFTSDEVADKLIEKHNKGLEVQGVLEKFQSKYNNFDEMKDAGIDVHYDGNPRLMHHKVFIIDGRIVITGSYNPTASANKNNDENMLVFFDESVASAYLSEFSRVLQLSQVSR